MRVLVISDIHGNLPALEYALQQERDVDLVISLGDVVNYGPWSNECVDLLDSLKRKILLKGNHETAYLTGMYPGENEVAKAFFNFCYPDFSRYSQIQDYVDRYEFGGFEFIHTINGQYIFPDTEVHISKNTFIGHSHRIFRKDVGGYTLVNAGSVGQNRNNMDELCYVVWQPFENVIELITKPFDGSGLLKEMRQRHYPEICINYIESKLGSKHNGK